MGVGVGGNRLMCPRSMLDINKQEGSGRYA